MSIDSEDVDLEGWEDDDDEGDELDPGDDARQVLEDLEAEGWL